MDESNHPLLFQKLQGQSYLINRLSPNVQTPNHSVTNAYVNGDLQSLLQSTKKADRKRLFNMMNDLPTIFEVVTGSAKKQSNDKSSVSNNSSNRSKSNAKPKDEEEEEEGVEEQNNEEKLNVVLVVRCMQRMSFGFVATNVKTGFMENIKITPTRTEHIKNL